MQLYKPRGFNEYFNDTFVFLKEHGKHYLKNYFIINGALLIILAVITYYLSQYYTNTVMGGLLGGAYQSSSPIDAFANENFGAFIVLLIVFILLAIILGVVSYAYTPIYFRLFEANDGENFETKDIINAYKKNIPKLILFIVFGILLAIPLGIAFGIIGFIMAITLVGIIGLPFLVAFGAGLYNMTLLEYLDSKRNFWDSFGYAWTLITSKFWHVIGCMGIFYVITYIIQLGLNLLQSTYGMANVLTQIEPVDVDTLEPATNTVIFMVFFFVLSFIVSITMSIINQVNQSIIYFSLKEDNEHINTKSTIDQIGSGDY